MAKFNWHRLLEKAWLYTKIFFAVLTLCVISYAYGTYNPNKSAIAEVNAELDLFYMQKIEEMGLQEPEFTYSNDIQFIRAMHKCINYINFSLPKDDMRLALCAKIGEENLRFIDAMDLTKSLLGDTIYTNVFLLGSAWQMGLVPLSLESILEAIRLNGRDVEGNLKASRLLEVLKNARIEGDIFTPCGGLKFMIGGAFKGNFFVIPAVEN